MPGTHRHGGLTQRAESCPQPEKELNQLQIASGPETTAGLRPEQQLNAGMKAAPKT